MNTLQLFQTNPIQAESIQIITLPREYRQPLADYLAIGWQRYKVARNAFVYPVTTGFYAYEQRTEWHVCAVAAAYIGITGHSAEEAAGLDFDSARFALAMRTGVDYGKMLVPAAHKGHEGQMMTMLKALAGATDAGWPALEIVEYARHAEAWHWQKPNLKDGEMNEKKMRNEQETLEDVLDAYVASTSVPSQQALKEWIRRYPYYRRELIEFTVSWTMTEHLPPSPAVEETEEELLVLRGMSIVQSIMNEQKPKGYAGKEHNYFIR